MCVRLEIADKQFLLFTSGCIYILRLHSGFTHTRGRGGRRSVRPSVRKHLPADDRTTGAGEGHKEDGMRRPTLNRHSVCMVWMRRSCPLLLGCVWASTFFKVRVARYENIPCRSGLEKMALAHKKWCCVHTMEVMGSMLFGLQRLPI